MYVVVNSLGSLEYDLMKDVECMSSVFIVAVISERMSYPGT